MGEPILSSSDLADLRQLSEASLPHRARVLTPTLVRQAGGVTAFVYPDATLVAPIACRVQRATAEAIARFSAGAYAELPLSLVVFAVDDVDTSALMIETKLVVDGETNGATWSVQLKVIGVEPHHSYQTQRRALCVPTTS